MLLVDVSAHLNSVLGLVENLETGMLRRAVKRSVSEPDGDGDECDADVGGGEEESLPDNQSILRLLEPNEKVSCGRAYEYPPIEFKSMDIKLTRNN